MDIELITTLPWGKNKDELGKIQVPVASDLHIHYHKRYTLINFLKKCNCCGNRSPYPFTISAIKWRETYTEHKLQDRNSIQGKLVPTEVHVASSGSLPLFKRKKCIVSKVIDQKPTLGGSIQKIQKFLINSRPLSVLRLITLQWELELLISHANIHTLQQLL